MSRCRSCDEPIRWAKTPSGKSIPLNATPTHEGNVAVRVEAGIARAYVLVGVELANMRSRQPLLYTAHHATCAQRDEWRRNRAAKAAG